MPYTTTNKVMNSSMNSGAAQKQLISMGPSATYNDMMDISNSSKPQADGKHRGSRWAMPIAIPYASSAAVMPKTT